MTLSMRLVGEQVTHIPSADSYVWSSGLFKNIFEAVVEAPEGQALQAEFSEKFVKAYEDVRYHTFTRISYVNALMLTQVNSNIKPANTPP